MGVFRFKQFSVNDDKCSMKVGTDGVLLGAWCEVGNAKKVLDIGTGSGVIALMMAQRSRPDTTIHAVELLKEAAAQAIENITASPWLDKVTVFHTPIQDFHPSLSYDLIVCNPPYFSKSLLPPAATRRTARHDESLNYEGLIGSVIRLLSRSGTFCTILAFPESEAFASEARACELFLQHQTQFYSRSGKPQVRALMQFGFSPAVPMNDSLTLYQNGNEWSSEYTLLTQDFYVHPSPGRQNR